MNHDTVQVKPPRQLATDAAPVDTNTLAWAMPPSQIHATTSTHATDDGSPQVRADGSEYRPTASMPGSDGVSTWHANTAHLGTSGRDDGQPPTQAGTTRDGHGPRRHTDAERRLLDTMLAVSPRAFAVTAPTFWHKAAVQIQSRFRGHLARKRYFQRGATMFKSHFAYMHMRPLTATETVLLVSLGVFHQVAFVVIFTEMGVGDEMYRTLAPLSAMGFIVGSAGVLLFTALFLLDVHLWTRAWAVVKWGLGGTGLLLVVAGLIMAVGRHPQLPLCVYLFAVPLVYYALRLTVLSEVSMSRFLLCVAAPSTAGGAAMSLGWILFVAITGNVWSGDVKRNYYERVLCDPEAASCTAAALLYFSPLGCGMINLAFGLVCWLLSLSVVPKRRKTLHIMARIFMGSVLLIVAAVYVSAAVSGANSQFANTLLVIAIAGLVLMAVVVGNSVGWDMLHERFVNIPLVKKLAQSIFSDWAKACLFFGGWVPFSLYFLLSLVKQRVRVLAWLPRGKDLLNDFDTGIVVKRHDWLTHSAKGVLEFVLDWAWTSVLTKAIWLGVFFMVMNLGFGKLTYVFLSWLVYDVIPADTSLAVVVVVIVGVGLLLFMIPPVPGFAVYLMASVLIPRFMEFWTGVLVAVAASFGLKIVALVIQQKIIGERMGDRVAVRAFIGYNSITVRAIRKILSQPGLGLPKVCILVGGPDWPTSVATGILRLPLLQMILGTTPVIIVVAAVTIAGAFQTRKAEGGVWASVSSITLSLASAVMFASLVASAYYIEDTAERHRDELESIPRDEEVEKEDRRKEERRRVYAMVTAWTTPEHSTLTPHMPWWMKANLVMGISLQLVACYVAQFAAERCFVQFEITDTIAERLDGEWTNIIKPLGRIVLLIWAISCANLLVFRTWAITRVRAYHRMRREDSASAKLAAEPLPLADPRTRVTVA